MPEGVAHIPTIYKPGSIYSVIKFKILHHYRKIFGLMIEIAVHYYQCLALRFFNPFPDRFSKAGVGCPLKDFHKIQILALNQCIGTVRAIVIYNYYFMPAE